MNRAGTPLVLIVVLHREELADLASGCERAGSEVVVARDAEVALRVAAERDVDGVFLDLVYPSQEAAVLMGALHGFRPELPVVAVVAHGDHASEREARRLGASELLIVPAGPEEIRLRCLAVLELVRLRSRCEGLEKRLLAEVPRDFATGLARGDAFRDHLAREYARARRHHHPLVLLHGDVDRLAAVSADHGEEVGDNLVRLIAETLRRSVRESDIVGRVDDDTFAVLAPDTDLEQGLALAERLRERVAEVTHRGTMPGATLSIGVAGVPGANTASALELASLADEAVRFAKRRGGNRCAVAGDI